ncbi:MAG: hypothetical protein R3212_10980 [Xanthomonadales bacterium]|nr:hypothetical protein [Xanthomonadales bacterium]
MPRALKYTALIVFGITAVVWAYALTQHRFLMREFWLYVGIFMIPGLAICFSLWLLMLKKWWWKLIGFVLLIGSVGVWVLSLLLVWVGFKIH